MSNRDKGKLLALGGVVFAIALFVAAVIGVPLIPWQIVGVIAGVGQFCYYAPMLAKRYYEINDVDPGIKWVIPIYNEIMIQSPVMANVSLVSVIITAVIGIISQLPLSLIGRVFSMHTTVGWQFNLMAIVIIAAVITNFIVAIGLCGVLKTINFMIYSSVGEPVSKVEFMYYVMLMIPLIRIAVFAIMLSKLRMLKQFGYGEEDETEFEEVE